MNVNRDDRRFYTSIGLVLLLVIGAYGGLVLHTGFSTPFSVVMSQSMQHDDDMSQTGCIDTGDIVVVRSPGKSDIVSYVEGHSTGYSSFGDYGSVVIYDRGNNSNPVIHRAIVWLEWDPRDNVWRSPSLEDYDGWYCVGMDGQVTKDPDRLSGKLKFTDITRSGKDVEVNLDTLGKVSGYLTMGDNPESNPNFDQTSGIVDHPIPYEDIRSVPFMEIPWMGTMKILLKNDGRNLEHVPNSLPSLLMEIVLLFSILLLVDQAFTIRNRRKNPAEEKKGEEDGK